MTPRLRGSRMVQIRKYLEQTLTRHPSPFLYGLYLSIASLHWSCTFVDLLVVGHTREHTFSDLLLELCGT